MTTPSSSDTFLITQQSADNFFQLFELAVDFDVDIDILNHQRNQLQKRYHPDIQATAENPLNQQQIEQTSALINHAYQTLHDIDSRAEHLLSLHGQTINANKTIADVDFLDNAMNIRIQLDDALDNQDNPALLALKTELQVLVDTQAATFKQNYVQQHWDKATDCIQKLKFLVKIDKSIQQGVDEIAQSQNNNDDDLYV